MFWSGETLGARLPNLVTPYFADRIDCSAYRLSIGPEIYISPSDQSVDPKSVTIRPLVNDEAFTIPPGQFGFILTEEVVQVPAEAVAFISIRTKTKFRGLMNVSGFHVDPGYNGRLTFAVFNAGPVPVHLKRGQQIFLLWYAALDQATQSKKNTPNVQRGIDPEVVPAIAGELQSFASLSAKVKDVDKALGDRIHAIEKEQQYYRVLGAIALALMIGVTLNWLKGDSSSTLPRSGMSQQAPATPALPFQPAAVPSSTPATPPSPASPAGAAPGR